MMQLTPLQLEIQQRAEGQGKIGSIAYRWEQGYYPDVFCFVGPNGVFYDKMGCLISCPYYEAESNFGVPMNWGRLCWLYRTSMRRKPDNKVISEFVDLETRFDVVFDCYQQTVLERPVELQELVLDFLKSLGPL